MSNMVRTSIFAEDKREFTSFLKDEGFSNFRLTPTGNRIFLDIEFKTPASIMNYKLRGVETKFKASRSNTYYYDLDQDWDDEADEFFGDNGDDL